jgi:hypothetical protein
MYSFKNYHTRRVVVRNERPFVKALVLSQSMWLFKFPTKWITHKYPFSEGYIHVYVNYCLKKRMPIEEAIGRYHDKLRKDDKNV